MPYYSKKPETIEAIQLSWANWDTIVNDFPGIVEGDNQGITSAYFHDRCGEKAPYIALNVPSKHGWDMAK